MCGGVEVTPPVPDDHREKEAVMARTPGAGTEAVLGALSRRTGRTAAEVANAVGIGRSTANKALAALESEDKARRESGGRDGARRLPDLWLRTSSNGPGRKSTSGGPRLGKGELAGLVRKHLKAQPKAEFT